MANYKIVFKRSVAKDLRRISNQDVTRILNRIESLAVDPRLGAEKLSGQERYRIRQGVYRIIYEIVDQALIVVVVKVGHRRDVYKNR
ncbi:type II toxin-antitoxin system RelE/ParE family toxin [Acaryochloris sp. CCMEE 5410]|uniref:type II toxin-antitoxin system RelE family toxin n=1 Tax=Acaryochloris sp. CCMEE 5410 TaxID=310037 RepID=UPI000248472A|nr:type II toxin-antitoxin system RelE/ParE family toxin [Acaryochloris sp. CCMEE 5410]KAI9134040.1 type II toxin-antitoxin system RelE/ParE family toxin [Acaryochloris sp. CCMEE 5410]